MVKAMYFGGEKFDKSYVGATIDDLWLSDNTRADAPVYYEIYPVTKKNTSTGALDVVGYSFAKDDAQITKGFGKRYVVGSLTWNDDLYLAVVGDSFYTASTGSGSDSQLHWLKYSDVAGQLSMGG